ncbi:hypothetical protein E2C01_035340 [Portunus trituberculatus]|uniref:Uncharacterized protein n=1 Tax=Portunus trituberculatus TaxID=210409 RepID=A0A5B7F876_PORTR|nr:hypothetical protein [Portunus trituberculatus]
MYNDFMRKLTPLGRARVVCLSGAAGEAAERTCELNPVASLRATVCGVGWAVVVVRRRDSHDTSVEHSPTRRAPSDSQRQVSPHFLDSHFLTVVRPHLETNTWRATPEGNMRITK